MKASNRFTETKIKLAMKLRGLTREEAVKALHLDSAPNRTDVCKTRHSIARTESSITVEELFGDSDDADEFMSAEEFFK